MFKDTTQTVRGSTSVAVTSTASVPPPMPKVTGTWRDSELEVCFNVSDSSEAGQFLTGFASNCPDSASLYIDMPNQFDNFGQSCAIQIDTGNDILIYEDAFYFAEAVGLKNDLVWGRFSAPDLSSGVVLRENLRGEVCIGAWDDARPVP